MRKILLGNGKLVDIENLTPSDIDKNVIAHSISNQCRWNGHTNRFYSVAEHCVLMARHVRPEARIHMLLHDTPEAFTGDIATPFKDKCPELYALEGRILSVIYEALKIPKPSSMMFKYVRVIDDKILKSELICMFPSNQEWCGLDDVEPLGVEFGYWMPEFAAAMYAIELNAALGI